MQNIEFIDIKFKNFRCHTEGYLPFKNNCLTAIVGKNGKGKSSYLMAFMISLFGKTAEGIEIPDLVNKRIGKNLEIHLNFKIDDDRYKISRYYKHNHHFNKLILLKNEEDISRKTVTDTYDLITSILIPREVFLTILYFSQQVKDFFTSLTDKQQKEIFNNIFQLNEYKIKYDKIFDSIKQLTFELNDIEPNRIKQQSTLESAQENLKGLEFTYATWQSIRKQKEISLNQEVDRRVKEITELQDIKSKIKYDEKEFSILSEKLIQDKMKLTEINSQIGKLQTELDERLEEIKTNLIKDYETASTLGISLINDEFSLKKSQLDYDANRLSEQQEKLSTDLNKEIFRLRNESEDKTKDLKDILKELNDKKQKLDDDLNKINMDQRVLQNLELEFEKKKTPSTKEMVTSKTIADTVKKTISGYEDKLKQFDLNPDICPTCKQKISNNEHVIKEKNTINNLIIQCNVELETLKNKFTNAKKQYIEIENEYKDTIKNLFDNITQRRSTNLDKTNIVISQIKEIIYKINNIEEKVTDSCRNLQTINDVSKTQIKQDQDKIALKILDLTNDKLLKSKVFVAEKKTDFDLSLNEQTVKVKSSFDIFREELVRKSEILELLINDQEKLRISLINNKEQIIKIDKEIAEKNTEIKVLKIQEDLLIKEVYDLSEINKYKNLIITVQNYLSTIIVKVQQIRRCLDILEFWKEGFSDRGIPSMLIDDWIPYLNDGVQEELERVVPGKFLINFDTTSTTKSGDLREKFNINILNLETGADKHVLLSGGEKRQVDVCCMRALRKLAENLYQKHFNICLLDEVLDSLDEENSAMFCRSLKFLSKNESIILITHSITQNAECDEIIRL